MLYAYEIKDTDEGYIGYVEDIDLKTNPQKTFEEAENVLVEAFSGFIEIKYRKQRKPIPLPKTSCKDKMSLYIPIKLQLLILFWNTMLEQNLKQTEVAQKLGVSKTVINQMVNGKGNISVEKYEEALKVLGKNPNVSI